MPSRYARRHFTLASLITLFGFVASAPSFAQPLTMPSDPLAGVVIESSATPMESSVASPLSTAPMSPDAAMIGQGPVSANAAGSYYNPLLGSHVRARFNTQSYGQQAGTLDLGTMKLMPLDGGMAFLDGQVTLNDESHVGYNLGVGYRWMTLPLFPFSPDDRKIMGVSVWSDGGSKGGSNFFPQIGTSLEFLGDRIDFRANGYAPIGDRTQTRDFTPTTDNGFTGNGIGVLLQGVEDTALTVGEAELAGRLGDLDAWAFAGVYGMRGGIYDAVGGKVGLRGYVTPDLFLSVGVANDDEFDTNALVNLTWFIGRTRAENRPTGRLEDRLREPVLRNNYVASQERVVTQVGDVARAADGTDLRIVHVDSTAAAGGDGTFERPFNSLDDITDSSTQAGDTIYVHGGTSYASQTASLLDNQTFLGEGNDFAATVNTFELGTIELPETAPGARSGPRPTIDGGTGPGVVLADGNTVENLDFTGGTNAIVNEANGSNGATLRNLSIANTTGDGISLTAFVGADADDIDNDNDTTEELNVLGNVVISDIDFNGVGGNDIDIDADVGTLAAANIIAESIDIDNITSNNTSASQSIAIRNTTSGGTTTINNLDYNGGATGAGGLLIDQTAGSVTIDDADLTGGSGVAATFSQSTGSVTASNLTYDGETTATGGLLVDRTEGSVTVNSSTLTAGNGPGIRVSQTEGTVSVGSTVEITDIGGKSVVVENPTGNAPANVSVAAVISNTTVDGGGITIDGNQVVVDFSGDITTQNDQSVVINNSQANIAISGNIDDNGTGDAITINNAGSATTDSAEVVFTGDLTNEQGRSASISGGDDDIFIATDNTGGNSGTYTDDGDGILIANRDANSEVTFGTPTSQVTINSGTSNGVELSNNDEAAIVTFLADLDITTTSGTGIVSDEGQLDASNAGNTITTSSGAALNITGGSSTTGLRFENVTTNTSLANTPAVTLQDFDGTVTIDDGSLVSTSTPAVELRNTELIMDGVDINSTDATDVAVNAAFNDDTDRALTISNTSLNGGNVTVTSSGAGITTASLTNATNVGLVTYSASGTSDDILNLTDVSSDDAYNFTVNNTGSLDVNMEDVSSTGGGITYMSSGSGNSTLDVTRTESGRNTFAGGIDLDLSGAGTLVANVGETNVTGDVTFNAEGTNTGNLTLSEFDATGSYTYTTTNDGGLAVTATDIAGVNTTFNAGGSSNSSLGITDATMTGAFDYNVTGDGNLTTTMTNVTGQGNITLDVEDDGNGLLTMSNVNVTGADRDLIATGAVGSTGDLTLNVTNSGNTTPFGTTQVAQAGSGSATASFNNVTSDSGIDFDSASDTLSSLTVTNGTYGGGIDFDETGDGDVFVNVDGANLSGNVTIDEGGDGNATVTLDNITSTGSVSVIETGVGNATLSMDGGNHSGGGLVFNESGDGSGNATLTNVAASGGIDFDTAGAGDGSLAVSGGAFTGSIAADVANGTVGNFAASVTNGTAITGIGSQILFNGLNTGTIDYEVSGLTALNTGADVTAIDLSFGSNVTTADVTVASNSGIQTLDASVLDLSIGSGVVDFLLSGNTFTNNSASDTALIGHNGTTLNATVTGNTFTNTGAGSEFDLTNPSGSTTNLAINTNGLVGADYDLTNNSASALAFRVRGDDETSVNSNNDATINFNPAAANFEFENTLIVPTP